MPETPLQPSLHPALHPHILSGFHLVEADAGTGKTWTLATLVVRAIAEGRCQLQDLLVLTFTKAATSELALRVRVFLQKAMHTSRDAGRHVEHERLRLALAQIDLLTVKTIHGFCQAVVSENSFALDLPQTISVAQEFNEIQAVTNRWWREEVLGNALGFTPSQWSLLFSGGLSLKIMRDILGFVANDPGLIILPPIEQISETRSLQRQEDSGCDADRLRAVLGSIFMRAEAAFEFIRTYLANHRLDLHAWLLGPGKTQQIGKGVYGRKIQDKRLTGWLSNLQAGKTLESFVSGKGVETAAKLSAATLREFILLEPCPHLDFFKACGDITLACESLRGGNAFFAHYLRPQLQSLLHEVRKRQGQVSYDGLLQEVYALVTTQPQVAANLRERYPVAMIDESQDTDPLQWAVFETIYLKAINAESRHRSVLILVGDPKQSIYSFRGADVYTYLRAGALVDAKHHLQVNRRSHENIISTINQCFDAARLGAAPFHMDAIEFRNAQAMPESDRPDAETKAEGPEAGVFGLIEFESEINSIPALTRSAAQACAEKVATFRLDRQSTSIAVLVYNHAQAALVEEALSTLDIPCARVRKTLIWESRWARELVSLLSAMIEPGSLSKREQALFIEGLAWQSSAQELQSELIMAGARWKRLGPQAALAPLIQHEGLSQEAYLAYQQLLELLAANELSATGPLAAHAWLLRQQRLKLASSEAQPWRPINRDAVQVMTIHNSKGLEFDTVLLPYAWAPVKSGRRDGSLLTHHRRIDGQWRSVVDTLHSPSSKDAIADERLAEALRLFYVGVTRAEQRLFIFYPTDIVKNSPLEYLKLRDLSPVDRPDRGSDRPVSEAQPRAEQLGEAATLDWQLARPARFRGAAWSWQSYSSLARHAVTSQDRRLTADPESPAEMDALSTSADRDHGQAFAMDLGGSLDAEPDALSEPAQALRFRFPKGPKAGVLLHGLLEAHPLSSSIDSEALSEQLEVSGMPELRSEARELGEWLDTVMHTPLSALQGQGLAIISPSRRKMELGFTLHISDLDWPALLALIGQHFPLSKSSQALFKPDLFATKPQSTHLSQLNGFLNGFMDMVFEWQGQFYILDWKSNHLGDRPGDYAATALQHAIAEHDYAVQWCLYSVALLRWLRFRFPQDDAPTSRMGGVIYAFIRGMMGGAGKTQEVRNDGGVFFTTLSVELLTQLDHRLGGQGSFLPIEVVKR
jgi:exodeoxyribonuclease V beta subunit